MVDVLAIIAHIGMSRLSSGKQLFVQSRIFESETLVPVCNFKGDFGGGLSISVLVEVEEDLGVFNVFLVFEIFVLFEEVFFVLASKFVHEIVRYFLDPLGIRERLGLLLNLLLLHRKLQFAMIIVLEYIGIKFHILRVILNHK